MKALMAAFSFLVGQDIAEIAHPDAKARLAVKLLPKRFALLGRHVQGLAGVGLMNEPARRRRAVRVNFLVTGFDLLHFLLAYFRIMQGCLPVGAALENGEVLRLFGDLRDRLDGDPEHLAR